MRTTLRALRAVGAYSSRPLLHPFHPLLLIALTLFLNESARFLLVLVAVTAVQAADPDFFGGDRLHQVRISLPTNEWAALRIEHPDFVAQMGPQRTNGRPARAYQNHRGTLEFDGVAIPDVAVRKKGFIGSVSRERPALNFDFARYVPGRSISGLRKLSAGNNQQARTRTRIAGFAPMTSN